MISTCGIYSIRVDGAFNAPFVALNDDQAKQIVICTFEDAKYDLNGFELCCIGTLHMLDGIIDTGISVVGFVSDLLPSVQLDGLSSDDPLNAEEVTI